jgi:putative Ca2+/H+ antiporter (TMEM165/GDT1 family)
MESFFVSAGIVAVSEIGDKTQLLALLLAARFRRPMPIILGIVVATVFNHAVAAAAGSWLAGLVSPTVLIWVLGGLFIAMGLWALIPDKLDDQTMKETATAIGIFWVTTVAFFLAEFGDKTQIATAALAARYDTLVAVVMGTTLGMLIADVPAVIFGNVASKKIQSPLFRYIAAALFIIMGVVTLSALWMTPAQALQ